MKKFILAVFFDHSTESGGNFQQSLNNIFLANKLASNEIGVKIITTKTENIKILKKYGLECFLYAPNIFSRILMRFRETSSTLVYRLINLFFKFDYVQKPKKRNFVCKQIMNTKKLKYNSIKILTNIINMCDTPPTSDAMQEITEITEITEIMMSELISSIPYIQKCSTNKNRDETSLSYLIDRHLSQSDCIKLGIAMENYFT